MEVLYTAFNGKNNSSKKLLDKILVSDKNKLYVKNSYITSIKQLENKIKNNEYELIISFGQSNINKNNIKIEKCAMCGQDKITTDYDYKKVIEVLKQNNYEVIVSKDAGNYFCNNLYYNGLRIIKDNKLKCKMILIHISGLKDKNELDKLAEFINKYLI